VNCKSTTSKLYENFTTSEDVILAIEGVKKSVEKLKILCLMAHLMLT
jgi:hypothetical protein